MKKRLTISSFLVLMLLIISQIIWIIRVSERDKARFRDELSFLINNIVKYQATKQTFKLFNIDSESPSITLERVNPDSITDNTKSYGSYETDQYEYNKSISSFLEEAMTEMLFASDTLDLIAIESLFQRNFSHFTEISAYSFSIKEKEKTVDSLYVGSNAIQQLNDTSKGVYITVPLGTSGTYRFNSHFIFKPATATQQLTILVIISGLAVIAVALILFILLNQLQRKILRLNIQEKRVRGIIHDLKSPLSYIYSMLSLFEMKEESSLLIEGKKRAKGLSDNIERMLSEIKLNAKRDAAIQREPYDLEWHCREITDELQLIYQEKEITIKFNISQETKTIYVDPFYFNSCLRNLLDNAIKYSGNKPIISVTSKKEKNNINIAVADNGSGIPKMDQDKVFSEFFRSSGESSIKGYGIGLSSVRQIVKAHSGKIKLESEEGKGTVFSIIIPDKQ